MAGRARDVRYGRRGGRWADADDEPGSDALHRTRLAQIESWPWGDPDQDSGWGLAWWLERAVQADLRFRTNQVLSLVDNRALAVRDAYRRSKRFKTGADDRHKDQVA